MGAWWCRRYGRKNDTVKLLCRGGTCACRLSTSKASLQRDKRRSLCVVWTPTTAASKCRQTTCRTLQKGPAAAEILVRTGAVICGGEAANHA